MVLLIHIADMLNLHIPNKITYLEALQNTLTWESLADLVIILKRGLIDISHWEMSSRGFWSWNSQVKGSACTLIVQIHQQTREMRLFKVWDLSASANIRLKVQEMYKVFQKTWSIFIYKHFTFHLSKRKKIWNALDT